MTPPEQGDLFAGGAPKRARRPRGSDYARAGRRLTDEERQTRARLRERLERVAMQVALVRHETDQPFSLADVRRVALGSGVLTGHEGAPTADGRLTKPRELAWLGDLLPRLERMSVLEKFTLGGRVQFDISDGGRAHGNKNVLWRLTTHGVVVAELVRHDGCTVDAAASIAANR